MQTRSVKLRRLIQLAFLCLYFIYAGSPLICGLHDSNLIKQGSAVKLHLLLVSSAMNTAHKTIHLFLPKESLRQSEKGNDSFFAEKKKALIRVLGLLQFMFFVSAFFTLTVFTGNLSPRIPACFSLRSRGISFFTSFPGYRQCCSGIAPPLVALS